MIETSTRVHSLITKSLYFLPVIRDMIHRIKKRKKRIRAILVAAPAIPLNPRIAAMMATTKKMSE